MPYGDSFAASIASGSLAGFLGTAPQQGRALEEMTHFCRMLSGSNVGALSATSLVRKAHINELLSCNQKMSELKIDINEPVSKFVQAPILVTSNQSVKDAARLMSDRKSGAAVVTQDNEPIGIITEWDILSRLVARGKDADKTSVKEIMSSPLTFVSPETKVGEAITLMVRNGHRRLVVRDAKKFLGIITMSQVVGNQKEGSIQLAMLEPSKGVRCPYCGSILRNREELSNHVDSVHVREEILKGIHGMNE